MRQPTRPVARSATPQPREPAAAGVGEWLYAALRSLLLPEQVAHLRALRGEHPWEGAVRRGWTTDDAVLATLAERLRLRVADIGTVAPAAVEAIPEEMARRYRILPLAITPSAVDVATADPFDLDCERALAFALGRTVRMHLAPPDQIVARIVEVYHPEQIVEKILDKDFAAVAELDSVPERATDAVEVTAGRATDRPVIRLVDRIVAKAIQHRASDIHLEPEEHGVVIRYRIDGVLKEDSVIPRALAAPLAVRVKILAQLDIADRLRPQDGRARVAIGGGRVDLRISTLPVALGEKVVIRILDTRQTVLALDALGLVRGDAERIQQLAQAREGLVCVSGPTGSGKTTTLYSILRGIQQHSVNVVTVEDPVEYRLAGVVQVQVNEKTGLSFPAALRSILRQDPDVILIGEVRDRETAQIAVQAALTGHLVLTTLHTIDAASAVTRLTDLGVEAYKVAAALKGVIAQRLLRRLCSACRALVEDPVPDAVARALGVAVGRWKGAGCDDCAQTGYRGRLAATEVLVSGAELARQIPANAPPARILEAARRDGMTTMWAAAVEHVREGNTTVEELMRVFEAPPPKQRTSVREGFVVAEGARVHAGLVGESRAFALLDDVSDAGVATISVLVADGDAAIRAQVRRALEAAGCRVRELADGTSVLDTVDRDGPDVVILGEPLGGVGAGTLLMRLRARPATRHLPVVLLADVVSEDVEVAALRRGATHVADRRRNLTVLAARVQALSGKDASIATPMHATSRAASAHLPGDVA